MSKKKQPSLTQLPFDDRFFDGLKNTDVTLRAEKLNIVEGPFKFVAEKSGEVLPVHVTNVVRRPFGKLPDEIFVRDGKGSKAQTFQDMRIFYPHMTPQTPITVVSYRLQEKSPSP